MKNERKKRKENENKKTQVDATSFEERRKPVHSDKQVNYVWLYITFVLVARYQFDFLLV